MNPTLFFENFAFLADAPNGVQKLRELILQLVVMGKLVPQDPNDEPVLTLLKRINFEKGNLIKKSEKISQKKGTEITCDLPLTWKSFKAGEICQFSTGKLNSNESVPDGEYPFFTCSQETYRIDTYSFDCEALLLAGNNAQGIYSLKYYKGKFDAYQRTYIIKTNENLVDYMYLKYLLETKLEELKKNSLGTLTKYLTLRILLNLTLPIPPLAEQKRIVSKVDELMALCDKLEAHRQKKQEIQSKLNSAALDKMLSAENQEEFEQYWQRICENFDLLYDNPENVEKLKQAILQLAVQGKLVTQNLEDEPASVLIEKIENEKKKLVKEGKIKEIKISSPLDTREIAYELPQGWIWCRWNDVSMQIGDLDHKMPLECEEGIPYVSPKDFYDTNEINFTTAKRISREDFERLRQKIQPEKNDIIFPRYGTIGENRFVITENEFLASYSCAVIKSMNGLIEPKYSYYYSLSPLIKSEITRYINKTTQPNVGLKSIQMFVYPLPPLAEQKRIVEKIEQLMGLCDELEAKLRKERGDSVKLMEAVVKGLLEGEATEKTELERLVPLQAVVN